MTSDRFKYTATVANDGMPAAIIEWAANTSDDIGRLSADSPADYPTDDLAHMWHRLDELRDALTVWVRDVAIELGDRIAADPEPFHTPATGGLYAERRTTSKWDGYKVLRTLADTFVDPDTGVKVDAIPVDVLEVVLPACKPGQTSSKWNATAVGEYVALGQVREVVEGPPLPKRLGKRR